MVRFTPLFWASLSVSTAWAATTKCNLNSHCPEETPCCSQYGECGVGAYCLGGCDPQSSFSIESCAPAPICQSKTYKWDNLDNAALNTKYLGDASKSDWVYSGYPIVNNGDLLLTMPKNSVGTLFANNHNIWYGKISGKVKSSRGQGVVTAFILLSDVKDEIDFEFVGTDLDDVQTNYYFQGILDYGHGANASVSSNTFENWHDYEIDWTPDQISWSVDGEVKRTLKKEETWNATANRYEFPQSPSRMQLSLWPAGLASNAEGTIAWAGGVIDWNSEDIQKHGYYYATFGEITVDCYDPPSGANITGDKSYVMTNYAGTNDSWAITNEDTVLASFIATGTNMTAKESTTSSGSSSANNSVPTNQGGSGNEPGHSDSNSGSGSGSGGSSTSSSDGSATSGFSQGSETSNDTSGAPSQNERVLKGSLFAVLVALVVLVTM